VTVIEAEVHSYLRHFLRNQPHLNWPHQLTMARLVARGLRLHRSALMQTTTAYDYCFSYLTPALLFPGSVIVVAPSTKQKQLLHQAIPQLQEWFEIEKPVKSFADCNRDEARQDSAAMILMSPQQWLRDHLFHQGQFSAGIPTLIDNADDLEPWAREQLTLQFSPRDWNQLLHDYPQQADLIRDVRVELTKRLFDRPQNPYECLLLNQPEQAILEKLFRVFQEIAPNHRFCQLFQQIQQPDQLFWAEMDRAQGQFTLTCCPVSVAEYVAPIWERQAVVLMGAFLDWEKQAPVYRKQLGLPELTCLKFPPDRHTESIQLYIPDGIPMPNTQQFQPALLEKLTHLVSTEPLQEEPVVILVSDLPLKKQVATALAGEFGSRVQMESSPIKDNGILVCSWQYWRDHQQQLPTPRLLIMATIPLPSLENPLVSGQVAYYKRKRQDWFRLYLLPTALRELQRAIMPLREQQGMVVLLDRRIHHRGYGQTVLSALEPYIRVSYGKLTSQLLGMEFDGERG